MDPSLKRQKKHIVSQMLKAILRYSLIEEGDRVLVALSGGKDSSLLCYMLNDFSKWFEKKFEIEALNIKTDLTCGGCSKIETLETFTDGLDISLHVESVEIRSALAEGQEPNCFICSWNRRKAIFQHAAGNQFTKIAFGHHRDDFAETALLNLFFSGEFASMAPRQSMFGGTFSIIRPLMFLPEKKILSMARKLSLSFSPCRCPYGERSKRKWIKDFLRNAEKDTREIKTNIFRGALEKMATMEEGFTPKNRPNKKIPPREEIHPSRNRLGKLQ